MTEQNKILISVLAKMDAVFRPMRAADWSVPAPANLYFARQQFTESGVPMSTGGGGEASRKTSQRNLQDLAADGLLVLCGGKRRVGVRLTEAAEASMRALCGLPDLTESHRVLRQVISLSAKANDGQNLCPELWLTGLKNYGPDCANELWEVSLLLGPALCRGWIESRSDTHGRTYYLATDKGLAVANQSAPRRLKDLPEWSEPAGRLYHEQTIEARSRLRSAKPERPSEIGFIPLPCSIVLEAPSDE